MDTGPLQPKQEQVENDSGHNTALRHDLRKCNYSGCDGGVVTN